MSSVGPVTRIRIVDIDPRDHAAHIFQPAYIGRSQNQVSTRLQDSFDLEQHLHGVYLQMLEDFAQKHYVKRG